MDRESQLSKYKLITGALFAIVAICILSISLYDVHEAQLEVDRAKQFNDTLDKLNESNRQDNERVQKTIRDIRRIGNFLHGDGNNQ